MKNVNCKHCDRRGKCRKMPKMYFMWQRCIEFEGREICAAADRHPRPKPPPGPPGRTIRHGIFGNQETKKSIRAREDYEVYMRGYRDGVNSSNGSE